MSSAIEELPLDCFRCRRKVSADLCDLGLLAKPLRFPTLMLILAAPIPFARCSPVPGPLWSKS